MKTLQFATRARNQSRTAKAGDPMRYATFRELIQGYLDEHLKSKASYPNQIIVAKRWLLTLTEAPTRKDILVRHKLQGHGDFEKGASVANNELMLLRAAIRWGIYNELWDGDDPTTGIKKWKTEKREVVAKFEQIRTIVAYFERASTPEEIRDRAPAG
jgi:hypothetical protein